MFIYKITNKVNGKVYIGKTKQNPPEKRWIEHYTYSSKDKTNNYFHKAINKYGKDNFTFEVIDECCPGQDEILCNLEKFWIWEYQSFKSDKGYNLTMGGDGNSSKRTEETKSKISKNSARLSKEKHPMYGKKHSEETKKKMSENHWDCSGENHPFYSKHLSEETKKKMNYSRKIIRLNKIIKKYQEEVIC